MKPLALALVASALGTGCIVVDDDHSCSRSVTVDWSFQRADGGVTERCDTAGVARIDVWANNVRVGSFDCFGPAGTVALARGTNALTVEAVDGGGTVRYRDFLSVNADACGNRGTIASRPTQGYVDVDYALPSNACYPTQPTYMWLEVRDDVSDTTAFTETGTGAFQTCSLTNPAPRYAVPVGTFTLLGIEEVLPIGGGQVSTVRADCAHRPFTVAAQQVTPIYPVLISSGTPCF